jgi:CheY-like chemotaxis protein
MAEDTSSTSSSSPVGSIRDNNDNLSTQVSDSEISLNYEKTNNSTQSQFDEIPLQQHHSQQLQYYIQLNKKVQAQTITTNTTTKRILIVDDEPDTNFTFKVVLENDGFKVDSFADPLLVLQNFKAGLYDLVLLDIIMPKMNGFELYEEIKKLDDKVRICFLTAATAYYEVFAKEAFPDLDMENCFIQKPIETTELISKLNELMNSRIVL